MKKRWYLFLMLAVVIAGLGGYYWTRKSDEILQCLGLSRKNVVYGLDTPNITNLTAKDLGSCMLTEVNDTTASGKIMRSMMNYLREKEGVSSDASFIGTWVGGTKCFRLRISNLELYTTTDDYLVILKDGRNYKNISPELWMK
jgi:hypothetical protein